MDKLLCKISEKTDFKRGDEMYVYIRVNNYKFVLLGDVSMASRRLYECNTRDIQFKAKLLSKT